MAAGPPTSDLAGNIIRHCDSLADEVVRRVEALYLRPEDWLSENARGKIIGHMRAVLTDWFLGRFVPKRQSDKVKGDDCA